MHMHIHGDKCTNALYILCFSDNAPASERARARRVHGLAFMGFYVECECMDLNVPVQGVRTFRLQRDASKINHSAADTHKNS